MGLVIREEFPDISWHTQAGNGEHDVGYSDKSVGKAKLFFREATAFSCKKVGIKKSKRKAEVNDDGRDNALLADCAHCLNLDLQDFLDLTGIPGKIKG